ncbi:MAG: glutathione peroxidase [Ginsengibacter sp.]
MKTLLFILSIAMLASFTPSNMTKKDAPIFQFKVDGLNGGTIDFSQFKGKKILVVNTASQCGNTKQYKDLEDLYEKYKDKLVIVGFPANNFGAQEPGSNNEIAEFCEKNYGVTFPMAAKISVAGDDMAPIYKYMISEAGKAGFTNPVEWNFTKFLFDENGKFLTVFNNKARLIPQNPETKGKEAYEKLLQFLN